MKLFFQLSLGLFAAAMANTANALPDIVPGNYRASPAYFDTARDIEPSASACLFIPAAPGVAGIFGVVLQFDGGTVYEMACTRLSKGRVRAGKPPKVKEDASKTVVCAGDNGAFDLSLLFNPVGRGANAKLKKAQAVANTGENILFADFVLDPISCPFSPAPSSGPGPEAGSVLGN